MKYGITDERLAEMWCELNGWIVPREFSGETKEFVRGAFAVVNVLAGVKGLALWQDRCDKGLVPSTGERYDKTNLVQRIA